MTPRQLAARLVLKQQRDNRHYAMLTHVVRVAQHADADQAQSFVDKLAGG